MKSLNKQTYLAVGSILVIIGSLYSTFSLRAPTDSNLSLHEAVGQALAEQTALLLGNTGRVVIITLPASQFPVLKAQLDGFQKNLPAGRIQIEETIVLDPKGKTKYGPGRGLSSARFLRLLDKHHKRDALISFIGVPDLEQKELEKLSHRRPRVLATTRFDDDLKELLDHRIVNVAIVPRFIFPAPNTNPASPALAQFHRYFQIVKQP